MWGRVTFGNRNYVERFWTYPKITVLTALQTAIDRVVLDGEADFLLKTMCRDSTGDFRIRLGNSDGGVWFSGAGSQTGGGNDRVLDTLIFGNGQFPFPIIPHIFFPRNGAIILDLEDVSNAGNTISFAFHGAKLFPE